MPKPDDCPASRLHPVARKALTAFKAGQMSRREFLGRATAVGVAAGTAGLFAARPHAARAQPAIRQGGTLRIQQLVKALKDPRSYDWSELGNQTRGFLEYLVEYQSDGSFRGMLLESWEVNDNATKYRLNLRQGVRWSNGDAFTSADVLFNLARWCDVAAPGNSMASRFGPLINPDTGQLAAGVAEAIDDHTLILRLSRPDVTMIANLSDYPAAVMHPSYDGGDPFDFGIGTGPYRPVEMIVGERCVLERDPDHAWWGSEVLGGPYLDRVEYLDFGTNPSAWVAAAEADEVDMLYETVGDFIDVMDILGWTRSEVETSATMVIRTNQRAELDGITPYADRSVRRALARMVDNEICLELGYAGRGTVAANHHVSPIQPAYADIGPAEYDPGKGREDIETAGLLDFEHELITIDDEWQRNTGDAVAAQLRDAGLKVRRRIVPGSDFWQNWTDYPFSGTQWNHRPLAVQLLGLAYRSGAVWNETAYSNPDFDALLDQAMAEADADARRAIMKKIETRLREDGVIIQPYWRSLYNHQNGTLVHADIHPAYEIHVYKIGFAA